MHFCLVLDDNQVHVLHRRFWISCQNATEQSMKQTSASWRCVSVHLCVCACVYVSGGVTTLCHLCALSHWSDGRWEKKVTFPDIICHEQSRTHMAKSERPSMPIIEYISFGFDEALDDTLQTQRVRTLLQFHKLAGIVSSSGLTENFITCSLCKCFGMGWRPYIDQILTSIFVQIWSCLVTTTTCNTNDI